MDSVNQISSPSSSCLRFSIGEIRRATNNFANENCVKDEKFGGVYRGEICEHGYTGKVFVKLMRMRISAALEFKKQILSPRHHPNIISLVGYCFERRQEEMILVYEFMPNGSLYDYLFSNKDLVIPRLTVEQRLRICVGVAKGLCYLHSQNDSNVSTHGELRTENVLLDASLVPKISSLSNSGFSREKLKKLDSITPGTQTYLAPEPLSEPSQKSDVYAFGVMLLEVLCERPSWKRLVVLALPLVMNGELPKFTPEYVEKYISPECARRCEKLIMDCLEFQPDRCPDMNQILLELEVALKLQKQYQEDPVKDQNIKFQANNEQSSSLNNRCKNFSLVEIKKATNDFSVGLGEGGYAKVYYGQISGKGNNVDVAVKRMSINREQGTPAFVIERKLLSACNHVNIISLVGYCNEQEEKILVYEFMPNGSLYDHIHKPKDSTPRMTVEKRLQICIGVAKGLNYLHSRKDFNIIHSDLKTDNILLDANFVPKISDFGLSRTRDVGPYASTQVTHAVHGTSGYIGPECYEADYKLSRKADVYAFGVVVLEVLCEKPAWERLVIWAQPFLLKGELPRFVPKHVMENISPECSQACVNLIRDCLDNDPNNRPSTSHLISNLEFALTLQKMNKDSNGQKRHSQANSQKIFSFLDIKMATNEFAHQISSRYNWKSYRGNLSMDVFVKRITIESEKEYQSFQMEINMMSACHHANVISLLGYCDEPDEKILVYEFMPNGSLHDHLYKNNYGTSWKTMEQRLQICFGVAKGLSYLHSGTRFKIFHGNLKTNKILLDRNLVAKISGFQLLTECVSGLSNPEQEPYKIEGKKGYLPHKSYESDYKVKQKDDVYAFGVVFLEVLCEKSRWDNLVMLALPLILKGELQRLMPDHVKTYTSHECLRACESIIKDCLEDEVDKRPFMNQVVDKLEAALSVQMQGANY